MLTLSIRTAVTSTSATQCRRKQGVSRKGGEESIRGGEPGMEGTLNRHGGGRDIRERSVPDVRNVCYKVLQQVVPSMSEEQHRPTEHGLACVLHELWRS